MLNIFLGVLYLLSAFAGLAAMWRYRQGSPIFWFPVMLTLMALGTFGLTSPHLESDTVYTTLFFVALYVFMASVFFYTSFAKVPQSLKNFSLKKVSPETPEQVSITIVIFVISAIVTSLYYYFVGYNLFLLLLQGQVDDYSTMRLAAYSGEDYFAPGYVNQFKNILLPISATAIGWILYSGKKKSLFYAYVAIVFPAVAIALLGTGQRGYIIYTAAALIFGFILYGIGRKSVVPLGRTFIALVPIAILFAYMTISYAEIGDDSSTTLITTMLDRFTSIQQEGALVGFRYVYPLQTAWFSEWWAGLTGILPGREGSFLAHEVHAIMYGTTRGTVPLSSVGSAYYNGGIIGVVLLFAALGIFYSYIYNRYLKGDRSITRALSYGFIFFYMSIYVVDSPVSLIENGVVAAVIFLQILKLQLRRSRSAVALSAKSDNIATTPA